MLPRLCQIRANTVSTFYSGLMKSHDRIACSLNLLRVCNYSKKAKKDQSVSDSYEDNLLNIFFKPDAKTVSFNSFNFQHVEDCFMKDYMVYKKRLTKFVIAKAAPTFLDFIEVRLDDGHFHSLCKIAQVLVKDHDLLLIKVFDEKAKLNIVPSMRDAKTIAVPVPKEAMFKNVKALFDKHKIQLKSHEQKMLKKVKEIKPAFTIDDQKRVEKEIKKIFETILKKMEDDMAVKKKDFQA
ncbi:ribosome recycling factor [Rozella allomycis CSF55]|uniref:Ribosome recycling factor n=1 Tax=Rozella allomycis (strain CSF55) TaxID=988480 RepID=A0A4P9YRM0_ROZAC|nr:ribosome recycling factor [Rozella allomycis CSF55]